MNIRSQVISIVGTRCPQEGEDRFNAWFPKHIAMLMECKRIKAVTRFKRLGDDDKYPKYMAVYEFDSPEDYEAYDKGPELEAARVERRESWGETGFERLWRIQYENIGTWERE